ncbi:MAG: DNA/RNA nuclease SfsA [Firmicutes bacterium]|nr:DNA/RNA nuclease SfsA [Bacillota bacterium]
MKYTNIKTGKFIDRPNRFIATVEVDGSVEKAHVKNTGRCRELLIPGAQIYLEDFEGRMGKRKMRYSLIKVMKGDQLINMDSQAPNAVVKEALSDGKLQLPDMGPLKLVKGEYKFGDSRLDFYVEDTDGRKGLIEVKGITLEVDGIAKFPDAPTERGVKHIEELIGAGREGYNVYIVFVIQMKGISAMMPNDETHKAFGDTLRSAAEQGVHVLAYDCIVTEDGLQIDSPVPVVL